MYYEICFFWICPAMNRMEITTFCVSFSFSFFLLSSNEYRELKFSVFIVSRLSSSSSFHQLRHIPIMYARSNRHSCCPISFKFVTQIPFCNGLSPIVFHLLLEGIPNFHWFPITISLEFEIFLELHKSYLCLVWWKKVWIYSYLGSNRRISHTQTTFTRIR